MREKRPRHETAFIVGCVAPILRRFRQSPADVNSFLAFAGKEVPLVNLARLGARVSQAMSNTRVPAAFLVALLMKYERLRSGQTDKRG